MKKLFSLMLVIGLITSCCCKDNKSGKECCKEGEKKECCHKQGCKEDGKCPGDKKCHGDKCKKEECCMRVKPVIDNILTRVSVRKFTGDKISDEQIQTLLKCAMAAPSAVNKQPWAFMVIKDEALIKKIGEKYPNTQCNNNPACVFVVCGDMKKVFDKAPDFWIQDASAATENLLLAAHAMGLGAVWTGVCPNAERIKGVSELLQLPKDIVPFCIIPVGVPAEQPEIKNKWNEDNIHYEKW